MPGPDTWECSDYGVDLMDNPVTPEEELELLETWWENYSWRW